MRKVISLFKRNYEGDHLVRDELVEGAEWVAAGEGVATVKWDGSACLWQGGRLWRRYDLKKGKVAPAGFEPAQEPDPITGHHPGWVPVDENNPADKWHVAALQSLQPLPDSDVLALEEGATYEAVGPHFQKNPYNLPADALFRHGNLTLGDAPRTFAELPAYLRTTKILGYPLEGIVWWHPDGRMVKIKARDFGLPWPPRPSESR